MSHADVHNGDQTHTHHADEALVTEDEAGNLEAQIIIDALQNLLVTKNLLAPEEVTQEIERLEAPGVHLGPSLLRGRGPTRLTKRASWTTENRPPSSWASRSGKRNSLSSRTARPFTILSVAHCVPAIRDRSWVSRRPGTSARRTVPARCANHASCSLSSGCCCQTMWNCACMTAMRTCAT